MLERALAKTNITSYGVNTFDVNGIQFHGSMIAFPNFAVLWAPQRWEDITVESLSLLEIVKPKPSEFQVAGPVQAQC